MAEKTLNTRILLKYDTYDNWYENNPTLKKGEIAIATIGATINKDGTNDNGLPTNPPTVLIKVGDGATAYRSLAFISAKAADVYDWAKAPDKPVYEAGEITGIDTYIAEYVNDQMGISVDTDTQYKLVKVNNYEYKLQMKGKTDSAWADVADSVIEIPVAQYRILKVDDYNYKLQTKAANRPDTEFRDVSTFTIPQDDTDTTYQIVKGADNYTYKLQSQAKGTTAWTDVSTFTIPADDTDTQYKIVKVDDDNYKLQSKALDGAWTDVEGGTIAVPTTAVTTLVGADNGKSARAIAEEVTNAAINALPEADEYSVIKDTTATTGYAATYHLTKNGTNVGAAINIPKDMVVSKGEVITYETTGAWGEAGTYIVLTLANATNDVLYIAAGDLIEYVTGDTTAEIAVTVSADHKVSATIVSGSIAKGKLATEVQTSLGKADTAVQPGDLGTMAKETATHYIKKTEATGYDDILTATDAANTYRTKADSYNKTETENAISTAIANLNLADTYRTKADSYSKTETDTAIENAIEDLDLANTYASKAQGAKADTAVQTISTPADADGEPNGLKTVKSGTDVAVSIDETVTWVFDCGTSDF